MEIQFYTTCGEIFVMDIYSKLTQEFTISSEPLNELVHSISDIKTIIVVNGNAPWMIKSPIAIAKLTGATPAKNAANAAVVLRNALTACYTLEGTKRFSGAVWISARNGQHTS